MHRLHLPPGDISGTYFCEKQSQPQGAVKVVYLIIAVNCDWPLKPVTLCGSDVEFHNATAGGKYTYRCFKQGNI